jgi:DNA-binding NarL/FixJ family response regulator
MSPQLRIMLVDDHYLVRMGLTSILSLETDMTVCAEAASAEQAIELFAAHRPDVTLMDARLPGLSGTDATGLLRRLYPEARIVMLSTYGGDEEIYSALQAGAMAYLLKSVQREELLLAVRKAALGKRHIPPELAERLAERLTRSQLSARELDVLRLLVGGMRNRQIAMALNIAEGTAKLHVSSVLAKLGVADRTEAVTVALQRGIVQLKN